MEAIICQACGVETRAGLARVDFHGDPRRLRISLRRVAAGICPRCEAAWFAPKVQAHLDDLAAIAADGLVTTPIVTIERVTPGVRRAA